MKNMKRLLVVSTIIGMLAFAGSAYADGVWLDAHGSGEYLLDPLSVVSSWSFGGSVGIEARDLFIQGPLARLDAGYGGHAPWNSKTTFNTLFTRMTGESPREYRKNHAGNRSAAGSP